MEFGDLISRQAAIDAVQGIGRIATLPDNDAVIRMSAVEYVLFNLPSAQPERKKGKWVGEYPVTSVCSECRFLIHDSKVKVFAYCPNCGALMGGTGYGV